MNETNRAAAEATVKEIERFVATITADPQEREFLRRLSGKLAIEAMILCLMDGKLAEKLMAATLAGMVEANKITDRIRAERANPPPIADPRVERRD